MILSTRHCMDMFMKLCSPSNDFKHNIPDSTQFLWCNYGCHGVGGDKLAACFVSAISTSYTLLSDVFSFSIAMLLSLANRIACSSYLEIKKSYIECCWCASLCDSVCVEKGTSQLRALLSFNFLEVNINLLRIRIYKLMIWTAI